MWIVHVVESSALYLQCSSIVLLYSATERDRLNVCVLSCERSTETIDRLSGNRRLPNCSMSLMFYCTSSLSFVSVVVHSFHLISLYVF